MCDRGKSKRNKNRQHHPGKLQTNRVYGCKFTVSQTRVFTEASEKNTEDYNSSKKLMLLPNVSN